MDTKDPGTNPSTACYACQTTIPNGSHSKYILRKIKYSPFNDMLSSFGVSHNAVYQRYTVRPNTGTIEPGTSIDISCASFCLFTVCYKSQCCPTIVFRQPIKDPSLLTEKCRDKFMILSRAIGEDEAVHVLVRILILQGRNSRALRHSSRSYGNHPTGRKTGFIERKSRWFFCRT
jgi:hypothetical protein